MPETIHNLCGNVQVVFFEFDFWHTKEKKQNYFFPKFEGRMQPGFELKREENRVNLSACQTKNARNVRSRNRFLCFFIC